MNKYTPETLKAVVKRLAGRRKGWSPSVLEVVLEIHADAWQEQVERLERERETLHGQIDGETKALLARIEALERLHLAIRETGRATLPGRVAALVFTTQIQDALSALQEADDA